jgi:subtilisin family serine protease
VQPSLPSPLTRIVLSVFTLWAVAATPLVHAIGAAGAADASAAVSANESRAGPAAAAASTPSRPVHRSRQRTLATPQPVTPSFETWHLARIRAPQAAELVGAAPGVVIAIVDSGVDPTHPAFAGKLVPGANTRDSMDGTADSHGHGTEVAGVAAARAREGSGVSGVAPNAKIMPMRVTDRSGRAQSAGIAQAITWAAEHGARVINLSLEGVTRSSVVRDAAAQAWRRGVLVVAPAGNCGCVEPTAPTPYILTVAATDRNDRIAASSSTGAFVDLAAPGVDIPTTARYGLQITDSGTSLSSAVVAGVAALMFAANPQLTPATVADLLARTAMDPDGQSASRGHGRGRVDALAAVRAAMAYREPAPHQGAADASTAVDAPSSAPLGLAVR